MVACRCDAICGTGDRWSSSSSSSWGPVADAEIIHAGGKVGGFVLLTVHDCSTIVRPSKRNPTHSVCVSLVAYSNGCILYESMKVYELVYVSLCRLWSCFLVLCVEVSKRTRNGWKVGLSFLNAHGFCGLASGLTKT